MNDKPIPKAERERLARVYAVVKELQQSLGVSEPQHILTWFEYDEEQIIAKADGFGSAWVIWCEPLGEDEQLVHGRYLLETEQDAYDAVEWLRVKLANIEISRSEFFTQMGEGLRPWRGAILTPSPPE